MKATRMFSGTGIVVLMGLISLAGCSQDPVAQKPPTTVEVVEITSEINATIRDFPAVMQATNLSTLSFRVNGELIQLPAFGGMSVKKGDLLAKLDPSDFERKVADADATYKLAKLNFERAAELIKTGAISPSEHDRLQAEYRISKAELGIARTDLGFTELRAPKDGLIGSVILDNFENVRVGQPVLTIQENDTYEVVVDVAEHLLAVAKPARDEDTVFSVRVEGVDGEFEARSYEIQTEKDAESKNYKATLRMDDPGNIAILPGMSAVVRVDMSTIATNAFSGTTLPSSAVLYEPTKDLSAAKTFVWKLNPDGATVRKERIQVRQLAQYGVEVLSGIAPGDKVLVYGHQQLYEGAPVKVVTGEEIGG